MINAFSTCPCRESLDADDVSSAWLVWSRAAETALADAYRFSGGPVRCRGLVLGRGSASFRVVRLGGHKVRKVRGNASDVVDGAGVFLYRDSSIAPLLDMRRRLKAVMDVLIPVILLLLVTMKLFWGLVLVSFIVLLLISIVDSVTLFMLLLFIVVMMLLVGGGIGFEMTLLFILMNGCVLIWFRLLLFYSVSLILRLEVLECLLTLLGLMKNSERLGFPTFVVLGKGRQALTNSIMRLGDGCLYCLRLPYPV